MKCNAMRICAFVGIHAFHITEVHSDHKSQECMNLPQKHEQSIEIGLCAVKNLNYVRPVIFWSLGWLTWILGLLTHNAIIDFPVFRVVIRTVSYTN